MISKSKFITNKYLFFFLFFNFLFTYQTIASDNLSSTNSFSIDASDENLSYQQTTDWFAQPISFTSSNIPIIVINTNGKSINNEPKIIAEMGIISNGSGKRNNLTDPHNDFSGKIGIEIRGNVTQNFDKKSYGFETRDDAGNNSNVSLLGMPEENDWILSACYLDKTLMRNSLAMMMSRKMGRYSSRWRFCELVINDNYEGVYVLMEKIKVDKNRLNLEVLEPRHNSGDSITGGYIYEVAQSSANFGERRNYRYPKADEITPQQINYIRNYDDKFRALMRSTNYANPISGYPSMIDVNSFIDEIIVQEACKNSDAYGWSSYFHKDRLKKLCAGPVWDFDQALSNSTFNEGSTYDEWIIKKPKNDVPVFWVKLFDEPNFKYLLKKRWFELREGFLHTDSIMQFIDETAQYLDEAQDRNFQRWPILGVELWRSLPGWADRYTYQDEVDYMKVFLVDHLTWMDGELESVKDKSFEIPNLVISEIMYDFKNNSEIEFIELVNNSILPINLTGIYFDKGITYTFPQVSNLKSGEKLILAANSEAFKNEYGFKPFGEFYGRLDNNGEKLVINNSLGIEIDAVEYNNKKPWPVIGDTDKGGSLELKDVNLDNSLASSWALSLNPKGSPTNTYNEIKAPLTLNYNPRIYPNPASELVSISFPQYIQKCFRIELFNMSGKLLLQKEFNEQNSTINISSIENGTYLLKFVSLEQVFTKKLIIIH